MLFCLLYLFSSLPDPLNFSFFSYYVCLPLLFFFFFFNDTATTEIYTLSLHDALPISLNANGCIPITHPGLLPPAGYHITDMGGGQYMYCPNPSTALGRYVNLPNDMRSEEHTSELQSRSDLVCRLLLEKKKKKKNNITSMENVAQPLVPAVGWAVKKAKDRLAVRGGFWIG